MGIDQEIPDETRHRDKNYLMAKFISTIITVLGIVMGIICYKDGHIPMGNYAFAYAIFFVFVFLYTVITKKLQVFYLSILLLIFFFEITYLRTGGSEGFGVIWVIVSPLFSVYLFSTIPYYISNGLVFLFLVLGLWTPLNKYCYDFSTTFENRFPVVYLLEFVFGGFLKYRIEKTEKDLETQRNILRKEINHAALIQKTFLSKEKQSWQGWTISAKSQPMAGVTGDLYSVYGDNHTLNGVGIFDISGHGIASGLLTMLAKNIIEYQFNDNIEAGGKEELWETVEKINKVFIEEKGEVANYLTGILIKMSDNRLELVNTGHPEPILYIKSTNSFVNFARDPRASGAIGLADFQSFYISQYLKMESGDQLFLFTDGLTECVNEKEVLFGTDRLIESFKSHIDDPVEVQTNLIFEDINAFRGKKLNDDMTLMILKKEGASKNCNF